MQKKANKKLVSIITAFLICLTFGLAADLNIFQLWQHKLSDRLYNGYTPLKDIVIIRIDDKTISGEMGLGDPSAWSRNAYAKIVNNLQKYHPRLLVFDVLFDMLKDPVDDSNFSASLESSEFPVLIGAFINETGAAEQLILPNDKFINTNTSIGLLNAYPDIDGVIRNYRTQANFDGQVYESLAAKIVKILGKNIGDNLSFLINYSSSPFSLYESISFIDAYNDQSVGFDLSNLKDKIVLVGSFANAMGDNYFTPVSGDSQMFGVEIHANALQTLLEGKFLYDVPLWAKIVTIILLSVLSVFIFMYTKIRWSALYLVITPIAYYLAAFWSFRNVGYIFDMVHPPLILATAFTSSYVYRYLTEFKEKTALKSAFSKYVNPTIAQQISDHPEMLKLGGEKREITVLFTDIVHFTNISESLKPESLIALLNEYFEAMADVIMKEGGTVDKFEGDAIMAFFGAPTKQEDHSERACRCILKMRERMSELLENWKTDDVLPGGEKKPIIDFRCGVSGGEVIVGNVGSKGHQEYTAIGDIVNLGSRLEGANKKYETRIMVSEATYLNTKEKFEFRELDLIRVVGKEQPIRVYELLNFKEQLTDAAADILSQYNKGISLYHERNFIDALVVFETILKKYPNDGPSKIYKQRCEILRNFPPEKTWDGVFVMNSK